MTDHEGLAGRLRNPGDLHGGWLELMREAADEIEQVRAALECEDYESTLGIAQEIMESRNTAGEGWLVARRRVIELEEELTRLTDLNTAYKGQAEAGAGEIERLRDLVMGGSANIERLREALKRSVVAIDDWLHQYASELCDEKYVAATAKRIMANGGTLAYIANLQEQNRAALSAGNLLPVEPREGWMLVPREPTEKMLHAVWALPIGLALYDSDRNQVVDTETSAVIYRRMLSAAPASPAVEERTDLPFAWHCLGKGDGWAEDKIVRSKEDADYYSRPGWTVTPLYKPTASHSSPVPTAPGVEPTDVGETAEELAESLTHMTSIGIEWQRRAEKAEAGLKDMAEALTDKIVGDAMQEGWNEICSDTGCHPDDVTYARRKMSFSPGHWAHHVAMYLRAALAAQASEGGRS
jgi:hypothetical protein